MINLRIFSIIVNSSLGDYSYICYVCDKKYPSKGKLEFHMKTHQEAQYECSVCSKRFSTQQYLNYHLKVHPDQVCVQNI
jgi:uncharacterized Zn-finger protein